MPVDFVSLRRQISDEAAKAPVGILRVAELQNRAAELLQEYADKGEALRAKVEQAAQMDGFLRSAKPSAEKLTATFAAPEALESATLIAVDGSQINPSRHEAVNYFLINLGAIEMEMGAGKAPKTHTQSDLRVLDFAAGGTYSEERVGLERDTGERVFLAELANEAKVKPVITLTDGPLELWGGSSRDSEQDRHFAQSLRDYLKALEELHKAGAATAGYVDKPRADLVVRALEVAATPIDELGDIRKTRPLRGVTDHHLFAPLLGSGERSAIFGIQSQLAAKYAGALSLQFFYLNVGSETRPWLARVEIPAWVAEDAQLLDGLHATLIAQSGMMGSLAYPYVLHRAHEIAVVTREEREQITQMLIAELQSGGVEAGQISQKQAAKDLPGRTRR